MKFLNQWSRVVKSKTFRWVGWQLWNICITYDDGYVPIVVTTTPSSFLRMYHCRIWITTKCCTYIGNTTEHLFISLFCFIMFFGEGSFCCSVLGFLCFVDCMEFVFLYFPKVLCHGSVGLSPTSEFKYPFGVFRFLFNMRELLAKWKAQLKYLFRCFYSNLFSINYQIAFITF